MPRRKQGHCKASATGGYLKKKTDTGTELIENESLKSFTTNNDLVFKIKKSISGSISNSSYHEKIEREHIDASKSLNDIKMVSKHEINNNLVKLVKEQDENSNNRNVLDNTLCCGSNYVISDRSKSSKNVSSEGVWSRSSLITVSSDGSSSKYQVTEPEGHDSNSSIKKSVCFSRNDSSVKVITTHESVAVGTPHSVNNVFSSNSKNQNLKRQFNCNRPTEGSSEKQTSDISHSQMSGVSPAVNSSDKNGSKSDSQQMNYRVSTSVTESRSNPAKDSSDSMVREEQNCHLPSSVYGSPASSVERVLTGLHAANRSEENESSAVKISFLQEILQKKSSETISYDLLSTRQPNPSEKDQSEENCKSNSVEASASQVKVASSNTDCSVKHKSESSQPVKLKLQIPEVFSNDDSSSSVLSFDSQKAMKIPKITSPQILEQHISKIISENAAIVETLDPKWSRRYFKQTSLNNSPTVEFDSKKSAFPLKSIRTEDKSSQSSITEGSRLQSALLRGSEGNAVQKFIISPRKTSLPTDKIYQFNNLSSAVSSVNVYSKMICSVSEDEMKGSAIKSLLGFKEGQHLESQNLVYSEPDFNCQHPQNPEGSIIKDLLLKSKLKDGKVVNDVDNKMNSNSFVHDGNNPFYKTLPLKCPNCYSEFSEKNRLDIHLSFCKSATKSLFSLRDTPEIITFKQTNAQRVTDFSNNLKSHISEESDRNDGPILKKQLLLPLSKSPPMKRRKVSDSVLSTSHNLEQSFISRNHYDDSNKNIPHTSVTVSPHRNRSHSVHLFGGEVQILEGDQLKRIKIKTSVPGAFTPITNRFTDSFGIQKLEANEESEMEQDVNRLPSVVVTIAQPGHNSGGTMHVPSCRSSSVSPVVTITSSLSDGIVKYAKSDRSPSDYYPRKSSQTDLKQTFMQKESSLLNLPIPSINFLPGPSSKSFSTIVSGLPSPASKVFEFKPGSFEEISPIGIRVPISPGNKPFYSPIFSTDEKYFESNVTCSQDKERDKNRAVPTVVFTPSSPTLPTTDSDVQPINTTSISEPTKRFLAPTRPTSLPLKKKPFTMVGSTLISPETPRPKKTCIQMYLNGHAYTYLGLKCSTRSTYCCIYRPQPMFVLQETNPKLSMYSNWQVVPAKEELSGLTPGQMISHYCSKQRKEKSVTTTAKLGEPLIFTHSSYWTYRSTEQSGAGKSSESDLNESEDTKMLIDMDQDSSPEPPPNPSSDSGHLSSGSKSSDTAHHSDESNLRLDTDNTLSDADVNNSDEEDDDECPDDGTESLTDSSQPRPPKRVKIFEGGFKSNEDYTYVRGRGRGKYVCEECGIRCKKPSMLKKHIRTHTDLRPYKCKHCSFAFKTKGNLTKHMKSKAHHKKCTELGIIPVPTTTDDSQIDEEALAKQIEKKKNQFSDGEDADDDDDDDETDETDDDCESDASSMIISNPNSRMLTNGHSQKSSSLDKVSIENVEESRGSESISQQSEEQEAARSLLHLSAIGEPSQWSTSTGGDLTDVASSSEAEIGCLVTRHDPSLLSPQYVPQTMASGPLPRSKLVSDQWLSAETFGHRPRSYSADIPLGGGKESLTKYKLVKGLASDATGKAAVDESEFGSRDQYTRRYSISVAREARKPRIIQLPEWNALGLPTAAPKWPEDQPMDLSVSRDLGKYKSHYGGGTLLRIVTQEEAVPDQHLQAPLELGLNEQYPGKSLPVLSPQVVDYDLPDNSGGEAPVLPLSEDQTAFSTSSTTSRPMYYMQDISPADNVPGRKDTESSDDPPSPDIDYSVCSPVSPSAMDDNSYYYSQESMGQSSSTIEEMQSTSRACAEFIVPTSTSASMEEGKCVCRICNKIFAKSSHLRLHVNIHYFERPFRCDNCAVSFRTKGHLQKHKRSVSHYNKVNMNLTFGTPTVDNPRPFKCADCKIAFRIHGHLAKHLRSKMHIMKLECLGKLPFGMYAEMERSGVSLNEIDTTDCNNSLESLQVMAQKLYQRDPRRMRWQGPEQAALETECAPPPVTSALMEPISSIPESLPASYDPSCSGMGGLPMPPLTISKHLSNSSDVKTEQEINPLRIPSTTYTDGDSAISLPRYTTSLPTTVTSSQETSRVEIPENDSAVSLNRSGTCHLCGKAFKSAKFLQVHLYSDHSSVISSIGDVPTSKSAAVSSVSSSKLNCDLCGRMFPDQKTLQQHLLSHVQPRPFVCEVCDAGFTSSSSLIAHQATHQTTSSQQSPLTETRLVQLKYE